MKIGVLSLQGDFSKHFQTLKLLGIQSIEVRSAQDLELCDGLILPGGESTTILKLIIQNNLFEKIQNFGKERFIMGTCAGAILLAEKVINPPMQSLKLINIEVSRNAYGRQIDSFIDRVEVSLNSKKELFEGIFIRAPKIEKIGDGVKPLGYYKKIVVLAENKNVLVSTFHPELTNNHMIHKYFINKIRESS
ncbi:MAG: pyridoxal 5'-phosphate synthase glutaminase subunit PdxT [Calditrichota bacterium]|jgi:pyridoxal 5'-phosphate synthase pdxT subunit